MIYPNPAGIIRSIPIIRIRSLFLTINSPNLFIHHLSFRSLTHTGRPHIWLQINYSGNTSFPEVMPAVHMYRWFCTNHILRAFSIRQADNLFYNSIIFQKWPLVNTWSEQKMTFGHIFGTLHKLHWIFLFAIVIFYSWHNYFYGL